jgi:hypothetical protein
MVRHPRQAMETPANRLANLFKRMAREKIEGTFKSR